MRYLHEPTTVKEIATASTQVLRATSTCWATKDKTKTICPVVLQNL